MAGQQTGGRRRSRSASVLNRICSSFYDKGVSASDELRSRKQVEAPCFIVMKRGRNNNTSVGSLVLIHLPNSTATSLSSIHLNVDVTGKIIVFRMGGVCVGT